MKLCIDTCTNVCSVALVHDKKIIAERLYNDKLRHSEILLVEIDEMLKRLEIGVDQIDCIYVSNGPGSFTGIRIGVTVANTMAYANNIQVKSYSVLELMAQSIVSHEGVICSMLNAKNNRYYFGVYQSDGQRLKELVKKQVLNVEEIYLILNESYKNVKIVGDIEEEHNKRLSGVGKIVSSSFAIPRAALMSFIEIDGEQQTDKYVKPVYLEKSQAERMLKSE